MNRGHSVSVLLTTLSPIEEDFPLIPELALDPVEL
jgi:hypothetical protein